MREAVAARQNATHGSRDPRDELAVYLLSPLEDMSDIVAWWGVSAPFIYLVAVEAHAQIAPFTAVSGAFTHCA
jgi:hypothetical protein